MKKLIDYYSFLVCWRISFYLFSLTNQLPMKLFLSFVAFAFAMFLNFELLAQDVHHCAHDYALQKLAQRHSSFESTLKRNFAKAKKDAGNSKKAATVYQIPVVFHVV